MKVVAHVASVWVGYDQILAGLGELHQYDFDGGPTFASFLKMNKRQDPMWWSLKDVVTRYRWSVAVAYAFRNLLLHGGRTDAQRAVVRSLAYYGTSISVSEVDGGMSAVNKLCESYGAASHGSPADGEWSWDEPVARLLERCHHDADALMGVCTEITSNALVFRAACLTKRADS